jgi:hypothetical protein
MLVGDGGSTSPEGILFQSNRFFLLLGREAMKSLQSEVELGFCQWMNAWRHGRNPDWQN